MQAWDGWIDMVRGLGNAAERGSNPKTVRDLEYLEERHEDLSRNLEFASADIARLESAVARLEAAVDEIKRI